MPTYVYSCPNCKKTEDRHVPMAVRNDQSCTCGTTLEQDLGSTPVPAVQFDRRMQLGTRMIDKRTGAENFAPTRPHWKSGGSPFSS